MSALIKLVLTVIADDGTEALFMYTVNHKKRATFVFDYNSSVTCLIFLY